MYGVFLVVAVTQENKDLKKKIQTPGSDKSNFPYMCCNLFSYENSFTVPDALFLVILTDFFAFCLLWVMKTAYW